MYVSDKTLYDVVEENTEFSNQEILVLVMLIYAYHFSKQFIAEYWGEMGGGVLGFINNINNARSN